MLRQLQYFNVHFNVSAICLFDSVLIICQPQSKWCAYLDIILKIGWILAQTMVIVVLGPIVKEVTSHECCLKEWIMTMNRFFYFSSGRNDSQLNQTYVAPLYSSRRRSDVRNPSADVSNSRHRVSVHMAKVIGTQCRRYVLVGRIPCPCFLCFVDKRKFTGKWQTNNWYLIRMVGKWSANGVRDIWLCVSGRPVSKARCPIT